MRALDLTRMSTYPPRILDLASCARSDLDSELFTALEAQGRCYSVLERGTSEQLRTIGCHTQLLLADVEGQREAVVAERAHACSCSSVQKCRYSSFCILAVLSTHLAVQFWLEIPVN